MNIHRRKGFVKMAFFKERQYVLNKYSSSGDDYHTPDALFEYWHRRFHFTLDVAARNRAASKCKLFFTPAMDALAIDWGRHVCWLNPPYSNLRGWMRKSREEAAKGATVCAFVPAYTEDKWFHEEVLSYANEIIFVHGRVGFNAAHPIEKKYTATFGLMLVVFLPGLRPDGTPMMVSGERPPLRDKKPRAA